MGRLDDTSEGEKMKTKNGAIYGMTKAMQKMSVGGAKVTMGVANRSGKTTYAIAKRASK